MLVVIGCTSKLHSCHQHWKKLFVSGVQTIYTIFVRSRSPNNTINYFLRHTYRFRRRRRRDNNDHKYNAVAHLYFSSHSYVLSHILLFFVIKTFLLYNSIIMCLLCDALFQHRVWYHQIKRTETLPVVTLTQMLMINMTDLKHWNCLMQFRQWIQKYYHHSIKIVFDETNWILSALHNHSGIKYYVVCYDVQMTHTVII